jgi:hypothetical protein
MKALRSMLVALLLVGCATLAASQNLLNLYGPVTGVLVGTANSPFTRAATNADIGPLTCGSMQTFTGTLTGMSATTTGTIDYWICGSELAILYVPANIFGTSNSTSMTMTGLPSALQPATTSPMCTTGDGLNNSVGANLNWSFASGSGTVTFAILTVSGSLVQPSPTGFTSSASKGLQTGAVCTEILF